MSTLALDLQPGDLNSAFNGGFIAMNHIGGPDSNNYILAFAAMPGDGVLVLFQTNETPKKYYLSKFKADGQLDDDFGDSGTISVEDTLDRPGLLLADKRFLLTRFTNHRLYATRFHADGTLDASYGDSGTATVVLAQLSQSAAWQSVRAQRILQGHQGSLGQGGAKIPGVTPANTPAVCYVSGSGEVYFCFTADIELPVVVRVNSSGELDTAFNGAGFKILDLAGTAYSAATFSSAAIDEQQGLVIALRTVAQPPSRPETLMLRLNEDGRQDFDFGNYSSAPIGDLAPAPKVIVDPGGKLKLVSSSGGLLARGYTEQGQPDREFNGGEVVTTPVNGGVQGYGAGGASGRLSEYRLVAATHIGAFRLQAALARYLAQGALDTAFGAGGIVTLDLDQTGQPLGVDLEVLPDSDILISAGYRLYWLAGFARSVRGGAIPSGS